MGGDMNITDALTAHHATLRQLYTQSKSDPKVFEEFIRHLIVHHTMEEKYFYDLLQEKTEGRHDALEAVNEHHIIELIIKDAETFPQDHERFPIKVEGLGEYTNHHLDEEEMEVFPAAQPLFTQEELTSLGKLFLEAKDKLLAVVVPEVPQGLIKSGAGRAQRQPLGVVSDAGIEGESPAEEAAPSTSMAGTGLGIGSLKATG
jgi:hypothetical protein